MSDPGRVIFDGQHVRAVHFGETARICVQLDHGRKDRDGFPAQKPSRWLEHKGIGTLSIVLSDNSWFLTPENNALRDALDAHCGQAQDVRAIGFSMGGYGAVLLSQALHLDHALLFSPQYSIFPSRAPWDKRRNRISAAFREEWDDLEARIKPDLKGAILFDPRIKWDVLHARALHAALPGMGMVAVPFGGHPSHKHLIGKKDFWRITKELFDQGDLPAWAHRYRRVQRETTEVYLSGMTRYIDMRDSRIPQEENA